MATSSAARLLVASIGAAVAILVGAVSIALLTSTGTADAAVTITVDSALDVDTADSLCTLPEAIVAANTDADYHGCLRIGNGYDLINFDIGDGTPVIILDTLLPEIEGPVVIAGDTGGATRVELRGGGNVSYGLSVNASAASTAILSLVINGYTNYGIISGANNLVVQGSFIGTDATGTMDLSGGLGFYLTGSSVNIGGSSDTSPTMCTGACNLISGNDTGIYISGASFTLVQGNFIGTNVTGTAAIPNTVGVHNQGIGTMLGGAGVGEGNLISGNKTGADLTAGATGAVYEGNRVGTNAAGTDAVPNGTGFYVGQVSGGLIGGDEEDAGNIIAGNTGNGIVVSDATLVGIAGNFIGVRDDGLPLPNGANGIALDSAPANFIGDQAPGYANVIAHNGGDGIRVYD